MMEMQAHVLPLAFDEFIRELGQNVGFSGFLNKQNYVRFVTAVMVNGNAQSECIAHYR